VIDDELAPSAEQIAEREVLPFRPVEPVVLVDPEPGQGAALPAEFVAQPGELLLLVEEATSRGEPLVA